MNQAQEILQGLSERFAGTASVKQVYGEPIRAGARTIVPVARVQYFLGGGGGSGEHKGEHAERPLSGGGGGGGGWVKASPAGALEISETSVRYIHFSDAAQIAKLCIGGLTALLVLNRLLKRRR
jgi:uncharacterized spore protein YtfJ